MGLREVVAEVSDPTSVLERVLDETLALVPAANGAAVELGAEDGYLSCVAAAGKLGETVGTRVAVEGSMSGHCLVENTLEHCSNTAKDARFDFSLCSALSIVSALCVPLRRRTETPIGVFVVTSDQPDAFGPADEATLDRLTDFISTVIGAALELASVTEQLLSPRPADRMSGTSSVRASEDSDRTAARVRARAFIANVMCPGATVHAVIRERIERVLTGHGLEMLLQPIVALDSGHVEYAEALARFEAPPQQETSQWFADAAAAGLGIELELVAVERALALLPLLPGHVRVTVNVGPETLGSSALSERLACSTPRRVVVELTEHDGVDFCPKLRQGRQALKDLGTKLAIDDTGTGFASLSRVVQMAPEIIKLDRELTCGIDIDPVRRALARSLVGFAAEIGAKVVAEGIETGAELEVLADLGAAYGQGYYLARPGSVDELCRMVRLPVELASLGSGILRTA